VPYVTFSLTDVPSPAYRSVAQSPPPGAACTEGGTSCIGPRWTDIDIVGPLARNGIPTTACGGSAKAGEAESAKKATHPKE